MGYAKVAILGNTAAVSPKPWHMESNLLKSYPLYTMAPFSMTLS